MDITLTNDRSLLNFVFLTGVGNPNELCKHWRKLNLNCCMVTGKESAFSSVSAVVKINWFWNVHVHFSSGTLVITCFYKRGKNTKTIALHDANGLLFCLADPEFL